MPQPLTGGCACGRIRFEAMLPEQPHAYLCHCRMCQRASGNVSLAMKSMKRAKVRWEREPDYHQSSPIARRGFCAGCGTSLTFEFLDAESENMDLTVASFDDPSRFTPRHHFGAESMHRAWLNTEGLPEYRTDEHQPLVDRWVAATGRAPD